MPLPTKMYPYYCDSDPSGFAGAFVEIPSSPTSSDRIYGYEQLKRGAEKRYTENAVFVLTGAVEKIVAKQLRMPASMGQLGVALEREEDTRATGSLRGSQLLKSPRFRTDLERVSGTATAGAAASAHRALSLLGCDPLTRKFRREMYGKIEKLRLLPRTWNGYQAKRIRADILESAKVLVDNMPWVLFGQPTVTPIANGTLQFEWHRGRRSLEIEFESAGQLRYLKWDPAQGISEEDNLRSSEYDEVIKLINWFNVR